MRRNAFIAFWAAALSFAQPAPRALQPAAVTAGGPAFTLAVSGQGFTSATRILWDGAALPTRWESGGRLEADIPAARIAKAGAVAIAVTRDQGASGALELKINPPLEWIAGALLPGAGLRQFYSQALGISGGTPPVRFSLMSGALPAGLHFDGYNGAIVGYATSNGQFELAVRAADAAGAAATQVFRLSVAAELRVASGPALPPASAGLAYSTQLAFEGGTPPAADWKTIGGALPRGLTLDERTGRIAGVPLAAGAAQATVRVRDAAGKTASRGLSIEVREPLSALAATAGEYAEGDTVELRLAARGGWEPYVWSAADGSLPPGLTLTAADGVLRGALERAGSYRFMAAVRDANGVEARVPLDFPVAARLEAAMQPAAATLGSDTSIALAARGGSPPYVWTLADGVLPDGLRLDRAGRILGVARATGSFSVALVVRDRAGRTVASECRFDVAAPPLPEAQLGPLPRLLPAQQARLDLRLSAAYPEDVDVQVDVAFEPGDPAVLLSTGGRSARLRIAAGQVASATPLQLQTGTTAGSVSVSTRVESAERAAAGNLLSVQAAVEATPPQVRSLTIKKSAEGFEVTAVLLSPTRELAGAQFAFDEVALIELPLGELAARWYGDAKSAPHGSLITYRQAFTVRGDLSRLRGVTLIVRNGVGASIPVSAPF